MELQMKKMDLVKMVGLAGTVLGIASTLISGWSQQKEIERVVDEKINQTLIGEEYPDA